MPRQSGGRWCYVSTTENFDWDAYLQETGATAAPRECFRQAEEPPENRFKTDMKLVTIDPRNQNSWCVATVITVQGPRMRLRLDGLDNMNDTWKLADADDIRPISWAKHRPNIIVPPLGFLPRMNLWPNFLQSRLESENAAPDSCFIPAPPSKIIGRFTVGQKLEAVDPKNPSIICVATVSQVMQDKIRVDLDGWRASYVFPITSRDIFPAGWCARAGLQVQEPGRVGVPTKPVSSSSHSPDTKQHNTTSGKSRNSLQPQTFSPDMRKRRKSSESSSTQSKQTDQTHSDGGSLRKLARSAGGANKKASKRPTAIDENDSVKVEEEEGDQQQQLALSAISDTKPATENASSSSTSTAATVVVAAAIRSDDDDDDDDDLGSPLRLIIDESEECDRKSDALGTEETAHQRPEVATGAASSSSSSLPMPVSKQQTGVPMSLHINGEMPLAFPSSKLENSKSSMNNEPHVAVSPTTRQPVHSGDHHSGGSDAGDHSSGERVSVFINSNCYLGPYLSARKFAKQPKTLGPAPPPAVIQDMLPLIMSAANNTAQVLQMMGKAMVDSKCTTSEDALKASGLSPSEMFVPQAVYGVPDFWRLVGHITERLQCCPNVFSHVRLTKACADCMRAGLVRREIPNSAMESVVATNGSSAGNATSAVSSMAPMVTSTIATQSPLPSRVGNASGLLIVPPRHTTSLISSTSHRGRSNSPSAGRLDPAAEFASFRSPPQTNAMISSELVAGSNKAVPSPSGGSLLSSLSSTMTGGNKRPWSGVSSTFPHLSSLQQPKSANGTMSATASSTDSPPQTLINSILPFSHTSNQCVSDWSIDEVTDFVARNPDPSLAQHADLFRKHEIDGKALLLLSSDSILKYMGLKLGPSLKLGYLIDRLRVTTNSNRHSGVAHSK